MELVGIQWNIQAARTRSPDDDPVALESYTGDHPDYISACLASTAFDFVTLQEVHANSERNQADEIARQLGDVHAVTDSYGTSFMNPEFDICQSVISQYPIIEHRYLPLQFAPYTPVNLQDLDGEYLAKDTGLTAATIDINGSLVAIATLHMQPFGLFAIDPYGDAAKELRNSLEAQLRTLPSPWILQGDFNINSPSIDRFLGGIADLDGYAGLLQTAPTIPAGKTIDHIASLHATPIHTSVDTAALTDHYPVKTVFKI